MTDSKIQKPSAKRRPPNAGKGRKAGVLNKVTQTAKDAIAKAADALGGTERLVAWVKEEPKNEHAFWTTIYPKLLPLQVTGEGGGPVRIIASDLDERI